MFKSPNQKQILESNYLRRCVKILQLHLLSPEDHAGYQINLMLNATSPFLVRQHLLLNFITKNIPLKESEMLLYSSQQSKGFTSIIKLLNDMEKDWVNEQKKFQQLKITEKIQSINTQNACSSVNNGMDLQLVLKNSKQLWTWIQIREKIVRTELFFYWDTNKKTDVVQQPDLFKINGISHDKQLLNLCVLLAEHDLANDFVLLLSNKDVATKLLSQN